MARIKLPASCSARTCALRSIDTSRDFGIYTIFALYEYFGNTVGWDFQMALICKHSLNHKIPPFYVLYVVSGFDRHLHMYYCNHTPDYVLYL